MKSIFYCIAILIIFVGCKSVQQSCRISTEYSKTKTIKLVDKSEIEFGYVLKYEDSDKRNRPTLIIEYSMGNRPNPSYKFDVKNRINKNKLQLIFDNIFKKYELNKLSSRERDQIKSTMDFLVQDIMETKSNAKLIIKSNVKIRKKQLNYIN